MKILVADDSTTNLTLITASLQKLGHEVMAASSGKQAVAMFRKSHPDLIILDVVMEGINGFECAKKIRSIDKGDWIPIIFLSGSVDDESIAKGIDAGGDDYLAKPFSDITLAAKIKAMQRISTMRKHLFEATQKLSRLSFTDHLTGLYNRLQFSKALKEKIGESQRNNSMFALFFIDLDKFKLINDGLGHHIGDLLLEEVSNRLRSCLRVNDFLARMGGDEFALILNNIEDAEHVSIVAQKMIDVLSSSCKLEGNTVQTSASIGIALYPKDGTDPHTLTNNADIAMYHAKNFGRNNYQYFSNVPNKEKSSSNKIALSNSYDSEQMPSTLPDQKIALLNCLVNKSRICIDLHFIKKCIPLAQLQVMPNSPEYFLGLMNLAGKSIPIIDLGVRLNLIRTEPYSLNTPILLCSDNTNQVGFIVDKTLGLYEVNQEELQLRGQVNKPNSLFIATITLDAEISLLVNMQYLLAMDCSNNQLLQ